MWAGGGGCGCSWVVPRRFGGRGDARHVGRWRRRVQWENEEHWTAGLRLREKRCERDRGAVRCCAVLLPCDLEVQLALLAN